MVKTRRFNGKQYMATGGNRSKSSMALHIVAKRFNYRVTKEKGGYQLWVHRKDLPRAGEGWNPGQQKLKSMRANK